MPATLRSGLRRIRDKCPMLWIFPNVRCCSVGPRMGAGRPWAISVELWRKHRGCVAVVVTRALSLHQGSRVAGVDPVKACSAILSPR